MKPDYAKIAAVLRDFGTGKCDGIGMLRSDALACADACEAAAKLPRTADGVIVPHGGTVYATTRTSGDVEALEVGYTARASAMVKATPRAKEAQYVDFMLQHCFSTAALAAGQKESR